MWAIGGEGKKGSRKEEGEKDGGGRDGMKGGEGRNRRADRRYSGKWVSFFFKRLEKLFANGSDFDATDAKGGKWKKRREGKRRGRC